MYLFDNLWTTGALGSANGKERRFASDLWNCVADGVVLFETRRSFCDVGVTRYEDAVVVMVVVMVVVIVVVAIDFSTCCFAVLFCARFANDADFEKIKWAVQIVVDSSRSHHQQHAVCDSGGKIRTRFGARNIETSIVRHESIRQHQSRNVRAIDFCFFFTWVVLLWYI
jgi:hypothetical protein